VPNARTCVVSFQDRDGLEHSVVVSAGSLCWGEIRDRSSFLTALSCGVAIPAKPEGQSGADLPL
jgi:hypothetical protein